MNVTASASIKNVGFIWNYINLINEHNNCTHNSVTCKKPAIINVVMKYLQHGKTGYFWQFSDLAPRKWFWSKKSVWRMQVETFSFAT